MIPTTLLPDTELVTTRLGFGTSRLHYVDRTTAQRLFATAADCGVRHFDTAPSYGDGLAERALGEFMKGRRNRFIVATKVGIPPDTLITSLPALARPLRAGKAIARRAGLWHPSLPKFDPTGLRQSVEASLKRLDTDRIDILFLHQPRSDRFSSLEEVLAEIRKLQHRGLVRQWGLAGDYSGIRDLLPRIADAPAIIQTGESEWPGTHPPHVTYGALSRQQQSYFAPPTATDTAKKRLQVALARRPRGVVLVSTTKPENLVQLAEVAEEAECFAD
ncbi:MAG: hypothetical protein RLZ98_2652 [Pseudomonadota bacterium]|jgi:aryl-alcohol dehydrogenase-like predicted oxidoreductase